ncbi:hypothetical protein PCANC_12756 [Puccinia coronata f. sp. avenae]|uniref:Uncharacterized protein n=1 Tax=Puccinia coronata f. sp. avenae TaxID=200324 RepID=A0A2N5VJR7_9BASI|nr:hypothetical protein PCANC_12756 [Puccinia coronata f. sp. avenae]
MAGTCGGYPPIILTRIQTPAPAPGTDRRVPANCWRVPANKYRVPANKYRVPANRYPKPSLACSGCTPFFLGVRIGVRTPEGPAAIKPLFLWAFKPPHALPRMSHAVRTPKNGVRTAGSACGPAGQACWPCTPVRRACRPCTPSGQACTPARPGSRKPLKLRGLREPLGALIRVPNGALIRVPNGTLIRVPNGTLIRVPLDTLIRVPNGTLIRVPLDTLIRVPSGFGMRGRACGGLHACMGRRAAPARLFLGVRGGVRTPFGRAAIKPLCITRICINQNG